MVKMRMGWRNHLRREGKPKLYMVNNTLAIIFLILTLQEWTRTSGTEPKKQNLKLLLLLSQLILNWTLSRERLCMRLTGPHWLQSSSMKTCVKPRVWRDFCRSKKPIKSSCKGFWLSDRHLANHFQYATNSPPLNATVEERIKGQFGWFEKCFFYSYTLLGLIGLLEAFLMDQCKTVEFREQMEAVKNTCEVDHSGSTTLKDVYLLVCTSWV